MPETKVCSKCGSKNPANNNFCEACGSKLSAEQKGPEISKEVKTSVPTNVKNPKNSTVQSSATATTTGSSNLKSTVSLGPLSFSWFQIACAILFLITIYTRFDHLGSKPHHHDESMHSFYSYDLFQNGNYKYDPMMHGPFQFHGNALMYYLFGVSDATSRFLAATFGILTVCLAMLLRPFLGSIGSFLATLLIVFSPSFMYFDRFTREDAYILGGTFMMVVFFFRYYRSQQPSDFWLAAVGFSIAYCTKESIFLTIAVLGTYLFMRLLPWADVFMAGGITALAIVSQLIIPKTESYRLYVFLGIIAVAFAYTVYQLVSKWFENKKKGPENHLWSVICNLNIEKIKWELLVFILWWIVIFAVENISSLNQPSFFSPILLAAYFAILCRFFWLWLNDQASALTGGISIFMIVFTLLFTTFFTVGATQPDFLSRIHELLTAIYNGGFGGLVYWWQQHDVHRGDEPWYYYLVQLPANETISFLFSAVAIVYYSLFKRNNIALFLAYWYIGSLALFSWAGEKMPWLIIHPLLPALLLTAFFMGQILEAAPTLQMWKCARVGAIVLFALLFSYSVHSAILLSFYHEADPVESLVYVQSSPDTKEVERIIRQISYGETGGTDLPMTIEDKCSWPFAWFLRDFPNRNHPSVITGADNPIILTATESDAQVYPILSKAGYVERKYKLRVWWVPSWFKKGFPSSDMNAGLFFDWLFRNFIPINAARPDMVDWNDLKNWYLYRQVWSDLGSYNMRMWVRPDLAQKYGFTETTRSDIVTDYPAATPTDNSNGS